MKWRTFYWPKLHEATVCHNQALKRSLLAAKWNNMLDFPTCIFLKDNWKNRKMRDFSVRGKRQGHSSITLLHVWANRKVGNAFKEKHVQFITASLFTVFIHKAKESILLLSLCVIMPVGHEVRRPVWLYMAVIQHVMISEGADEWSAVLMLHNIHLCGNNMSFPTTPPFI